VGNYATRVFEKNLDYWVVYNGGDNLTEDEKKTAASFKGSSAMWFGGRDTGNMDKDEKAKYDKELGEFREKTKEARNRIRKLLDKGELVLASPAECPSYVISPALPTLHGGGHG